MPLVNCPYCGKRTFTISGWADLARCPSCGRPLAREGADRDALGPAAIGARNEARRIAGAGNASHGFEMETSKALRPRGGSKNG
jgi:sarcosine oxidase delta subunit